MKLIVNCTSLHSGGGIQVALSMLEEFKSYRNHEFCIIFTEKIANQIKINEYPKNFKFIFLDYSPIFLIRILSNQNKLNKIENKMSPDCVITIFGPSYWRPKAPHLMGYGLGHFLYPDSPFWQISNKKERILFEILKRFKTWQIKKNADYFHIETEDAKIRLNKYYNIPIDNILVASNSYHKVFDGGYTSFILPPRQINEFRLVTISAFYSHKNLTIINHLVDKLNKIKNINVRFFVTLPKNIFEKYFVDSNNIYNIGPVKIDDCPSIYSQSDALFLPTLLEIFSASYLEAMKMEIPILTSDLSFAHNICKDAALYFNPLDINNVASTIIQLANDENLIKSLKANGIKRLKEFNNSKQRAENLLNFCENIIQK